MFHEQVAYRLSIEFTKKEHITQAKVMNSILPKINLKECIN